MTDVFADIETLKNVLIAWEEGASDEKRMARDGTWEESAEKNTYHWVEGNFFD